MLCGDQVLRGRYSEYRPLALAEADPLEHYLASLDSLGHAQSEPRTSRPWLANHRMGQSRASARLKSTTTCGSSRRGTPLRGAPRRSKSPAALQFGSLTQHEVRFAVAEAMAHLDYLGPPTALLGSPITACATTPANCSRATLQSMSCKITIRHRGVATLRGNAPVNLLLFCC